MRNADDPQPSSELNIIHRTGPHPNNTLSLTPGSFAYAQDFEINNSVFYDLSGMSGLDKLEKFVSPDACYDGFTTNPRAKCHPGTRKSILESASNWFNNSNPSQPIMWLCGSAGSGKSSIAQTVAEKFSEDGNLAASFFFLRGSDSRGSVQSLVPTLSRTIAKTVPGIAAYIDNALRNDPSVPTKSIDIQFELLIVKPFKELASSSAGQATRLVVIDGLDECADEIKQKLVLQLVKNAATLIPLRFLICSRPESHIRGALRPDIAQHIGLEDTPEVREDIERYLRHEFSRISAERMAGELIAESWPPDDVMKSLVSKSSAQFIYASTVVKFVGDEDCDPKRQLEVILGLRATNSSSPFASLDQLYTQILSQQRDYRLLMKVLALVIFFDRPSLRYISAQLNIDADELLLNLRRMHSVLHVSWFVEAHHLSLFDFLRDKRRAGQYHLSSSRIAITAGKPFLQEIVAFSLSFINGRAVDRCTTSLNIGVKALNARGFGLFFIVLFEVYFISWVKTLTTSGFNTRLSRSFRSDARFDSSRLARREDARARVHPDMSISGYNTDDPEQMRSSTLGWDILQLFVSPLTYHNSMTCQPKPTCHSRTREMALRTVLQWTYDSSASHPIMWLYGPPGAGKSCIARTIAEQCEREGKLAASFFFSRGSTTYGSVDHLFPTLAWQLARSIPETAPYIELALEDDPSIITGLLDTQFDRLIVETFEILADISVQPTKSLVIIDGLDECDSKESQNNLLQLIEAALKNRNLPLRFLICSRSETQIAQQFDNMSRVTSHVCLQDNYEAREDIRRYLNDELTRISHERSATLLVSDAWPSDQEIDLLVHKPPSQFIYASTVVKFVGNFEGCDPKEQLDIVLGLNAAGSLTPFAELDQLYTKILSRQPDYKLLMKVLVTLVALHQPRIDYICRQLSVKKDELLGYLRGIQLLHISESHVEPCHDLLLQFLQDRARSGRFHVGGMELARERLSARLYHLWAAICNTYLAIKGKLRYPKLTALCILLILIAIFISVLVYSWIFAKILCKIRSSLFPNHFTFVQGLCNRI